MRIWHKSQIHTTVSPHSHLIITGLTRNIPWEFSEKALRIQWEFSENILRIHWELNENEMIIYWEFCENSVRIRWEFKFGENLIWEPNSHHILATFSSNYHRTHMQHPVLIQWECIENSVSISWEYIDNSLRIWCTSPANLVSRAREFDDNPNLVGIWHKSQINTTVSQHSVIIQWESIVDSVRMQWEYIENSLRI